MISRKFLKGEIDYPMTEESTIMALENLPEVIGRFLAIERTKRKVKRAAKQITNFQNKEATYAELDKILTEEKLIKTQCEKKIFSQLTKEEKDTKTTFQNSEELINFLTKWCDSLHLDENYIIETVERLENIKNSKDQIFQKLSGLENREINLKELEKNFTKGSTLTGAEITQLKEEGKSFLKDFEQTIVYYKKEPMVYDELTYFVQNHFIFKLIRATMFIAKGTATFTKFIIPKIIEMEVPETIILPTKKDFTPKGIANNISIITQALTKLIQKRKATAPTKKEEQKAEKLGKEIIEMFPEDKVRKFTEKGIKIIK